jgi:NADH:ubiquinone oxidoreductase subunit 3 (subunit A)
MQPIDPYRFDSQSAPTWNAGAPSVPSNRLPAVVIAGMTIDLVLLVLKLIVIAFAVLALFMAKQLQGGLGALGVIELLVNIVMVLFGVIGNGLVLAKVRMGIPFCWIAVVAAVVSIVIATIQIFAMQQLNPMMADGPARVGAIIGGALAVVIRFGLLAFYVFCLVTATKALREMTPNRGA